MELKPCGMCGAPWAQMCQEKDERIDQLEARLAAVGAVVEAAKNFCAYDPKVEARPDSAVEYMSRELALKNAVKELDPPQQEEK